MSKHQFVASATLGVRQQMEELLQMTAFSFGVEIEIKKAARWFKTTYYVTLHGESADIKSVISALEYTALGLK